MTRCINCSARTGAQDPRSPPLCWFCRYVWETTKVPPAVFGRPRGW